MVDPFCGSTIFFANHAHLKLTSSHFLESNQLSLEMLSHSSFMDNLKLFFGSFFKLKSISLEGRSLMTEEPSLNWNCVFTQIIPNAVSHQVEQQQTTIFFQVYSCSCHISESEVAPPMHYMGKLQWEVGNRNFSFLSEKYIWTIWTRIKWEAKLINLSEIFWRC